MLNNIDVVIAGAGLTGLTAARVLAEKGKSVLVIEKNHHIGGHCYDYIDDYGVMVHKHGPHIFHTDNKEVWNFLSRFTEWYHYHHEVHGFIDGQEVPIPFNLNTLNAIFPESKAKEMEVKLLNAYNLGEKVPILKLRNSDDLDLQDLAEFVYRKIFLNYTLKQWGGKRPEEIDFSVSARVPIVVSKDDGYFQNAFQGIPLKGYTELLNNIKNHENISIMLNTPAEKLLQIKGNDLLLNGNKYNGLYIHTGPIDELFCYEFGALPYRSVKVDIESFALNGHFQNKAVKNYPNNYDFTRITEFKYFQRNEVPGYTTICKEYPQDYKKGENLPVYVINNDETKDLYSKYHNRSKEIGNLLCLGRLGEYRYYDMDQAVVSVLDITSKL